MSYMDHIYAESRLSMLQDARMARTRQALHTALLKLIAGKRFDQITVRDITAEAGIGYATFFRHYQTKEALLEDTAAEQIRKLVDISLPALKAIDSHTSCLALCTYVNENRALWTALLTGGAQLTVREELIRVSMKVAATYSNIQIPAELGVIVAVSSIVEILSWWLRQPNNIPNEQIAKILDSLVISPIVHSLAAEAPLVK